MERTVEAPVTTAGRKVTLDIFDPQRGSIEFAQKIEPMFGEGLTHRAYRLITEGIPRRNGKPTPEEREYFRISRVNGQESRGSRFMRRLDGEFYARLGQEFDQDGMATTEAFYGSLLDAANEFTSYVQHTLFDGYGDILRPINEATLASTPSKLLRKVTGSGVDSRLRQESLTQSGIIITAAELLARMRNLPLLRDLSDVQDVLNENMFEGNVGELTRVNTYALYDRGNRVIGIDGKFMPANFDRMNPDEYHWKLHPQEARKIPEVGPVMVDITPKSVGASIAKALRRAEEAREKNGDTIIDIAKYVKDVRRMRIVVLDAIDLNDGLVDKAIQKVQNTLDTNYGEIEKIYRDDEVNGAGDESEHIRFKRLKVKFRNAPDEVEIMFFDQVNYLMNEYSTGHVLSAATQADPSKPFNPKNEGKLSGAAHDLYERWRLIKLIKYLWPSGVREYGVQALEEIALRGYYEKADQLLHEARVDGQTAQTLNTRNAHTTRR